MHDTKANRPLEKQIQKGIVKWIRLYTDLPVVKIDNEGKCSWLLGKEKNEMGRYRGASDLFIPRPTQDYPGVWIEIKRDKSIKPNIYQVKFMECMIREGYKALCVWDIQDTIKFLKAHYGKDLKKFV